MQAEVDDGRKVGIVTLVARRGYVAHLKAYGMAERETNTRMATDSLFRLYSMTKPVTSVALLMLYEEGKFQLSDPLDKYIPAMKDLKVIAGTDADGKPLLEEPKRKPTIHDVFRHTAGFGYGFGQSAVDQLYQRNGIDFGRLESLKELAEEKLPKMPLLYHPGEQWVYSVAHDVQAYLVEYFSGMPFDEFCASGSSRRSACRTQCSACRRNRAAVHGELSSPRKAADRSRASRPAKGSRRQARRRSPFGYARYTRTYRSAA